jgi:hypothetical protein
MLNNTTLNNKNCCEVRGGTWNPELKICEVLEDVTGCSNENVVPLYGVMGTPTDPTSLVGTNNFTLLDQECCNTLGYYYGSSPVSITDVNGVVSFKPPSEATRLLLVNNGNPRTACFKCPREIKETLLVDPSVVLTYITGIDGNDTGESCCTDYGYSYDTITSNVKTTILCIKFAGTNIVVNPDTNTVTTPDGSTLEKSCCEAVGYFYNSENDFAEGCYICPPFVEGNYELIVEVVNGVSTTIVIDGNGNKLTDSCCMYYRSQSGNSNVLYDKEKGCYYTTN